MNICHITSVHPRYDVRIFIKECQTLASTQQVSLIVADSFGSETKNGITIYDVGKVSGGRIKRMRVTSQAIFNKVRELNPDVVHFHDPELIKIGYRLSCLGYKVIYDVHEDVPKQVLSKTWIPHIFRPIVATIVKWQERKFSQHFSGIICATEIIAKRFQKYNSKTRAIHNYPILKELNQQSIEWGSRQDHLCYIGSISATRGILKVVESLSLSQLTLDLAGPFSDSQIELKLKNSPGYSFVNYHGVLDRAKIGALLAKARVGIVTLLPTASYVESLPIKLFEYMLSGIPVIASDFPLWRPIIEGYNCGILVDPHNPQEIAAASKKILSNPQLAKQMGENGHKAVLAHYSWEAEAVHLLNFYSQL